MRGSDDPQEKLEQLTKSYMADNKDVGYADALEAVAKTDEGRSLYEKTLSGAN